MPVKADPVRAEMRKRMSYLSERNFGTLWVTYRRLLAVQKQGGLSAEEIRACVGGSRWRDGRINVAEFEKAGIALLMKAREEHPELFQAEGRRHMTKEFRDGVYVMAEAEMEGEMEGEKGEKRAESAFPGHDREGWREFLGAVSKGTFESFWVSYRKLAVLESSGLIDNSTMEEVLREACSREDGSSVMNVSAFRREVTRLEDEARDDSRPGRRRRRSEEVSSSSGEIKKSNEDGQEREEIREMEVPAGDGEIVTEKAGESREEVLERLVRLLMDPDASWGEIMQLRKQAGVLAVQPWVWLRFVAEGVGNGRDSGESGPEKGYGTSCPSWCTMI
jgi:hypothetical protein